MSIFKRLVILSFATKLFLTLPLLASAPVINIPYSSLFLDTRYLNPPQEEIPYLLSKIIQCESSWNPFVCSYAGCSEGQGLAQIIPSTVRYCETKLAKTIDPFNAENNLECAIWLFKNEGTRHWNQSKDCWGNKAKI